MRGPDPGLGARRRRSRGRGGLRRVGLRRADRGGSAAVTLVEGEPLLDAARVGTREIAAELGGLSPGQAARRRPGRGRAAPRAGRGVPRDAAVPLDAARTLVAMSGGVDSAVAALLVSRAGRDAVAVTLELWARPGERRRGVLLLGRRRPARPLGRAPDGHAALHARPARRSSARASSTRSWPATRRGRRRTRASAATATCGWTRCSTSPTRSARRPGHRPLRAGHGRRAAARRRRPGQGPDLHALRAGAGVARADALPAGRADQAGGARAGRRGRAAGREPRRSPRTSASSPAPARRASSRATRASRTRPGRSSRPRASVVGAHRGFHHFTVGQRKGLGVAGGRAALRPAHRGATRTASSSARARSWPSTACAVRGARLHRPGREVDARPAALPLARGPLPRRRRPGRGHAPRLEFELDEPFYGAAPGQSACLLRGDVIVGWATITR